jgi:DNA/RNA-binding domain of Phe-tRNA-synthetase-like protein
MARDFNFDVSSEVLQLGLQGAYLRFTELSNRISDTEFDDLLASSLRDLISGLSESVIENDAQLRGFRLLHDAVKRSNRKNVASPENLLRLLLARGSMPRVNLLVDIYNLVSMETRLALGAHDIYRISGNVHLMMTTGTERFQPLGATANKGVSEGEYAYIDDSNEIICRLEVRQVEKTKVTLDTNDCFYIVQGNSNTTPEHLKFTVSRLISLTKGFCGGQEELLYSSFA